MQEERLKEALELMYEKMLIMEQQIKVLNEKQNKEDDNKQRRSEPTDEGEQLSIDGL